jgi:Tfp pilus assembly protein PilX
VEVVTARHREKGSALIIALGALTLVAIAVVAVASLVQSRGQGVAYEERSVRLVALADAAMAETLAELDASKTFTGIPERGFADGSIASTVHPKGVREVEVTAVGSYNGWRETVVARVDIEHAPRVLSWRRWNEPD